MQTFTICKSVRNRQHHAPLSVSSCRVWLPVNWRKKEEEKNWHVYTPLYLSAWWPLILWGYLTRKKLTFQPGGHQCHEVTCEKLTSLYSIHFQPGGHQCHKVTCKKLTSSYPVNFQPGGHQCCEVTSPVRNWPHPTPLTFSLVANAMRLPHL